MFYVSIHGTTCFYRLLRLKTLNLVISPRLQHWYISTLIPYTRTLVNWYTGKWYTWYTGKWQSWHTGTIVRYTGTLVQLVHCTGLLPRSTFPEVNPDPDK
jgi:hypothetical protein